MAPRRRRIGGGTTSSFSYSKKFHRSKHSSSITRRRLKAKKNQIQRNAVTTAGFNKRCKQFPNDLTPEIIERCPTNTSPIIIRSIPKAPQRVLNMPQIKFIERESDTLIRLKQNIKDRILIKNASSKQSHDYFSFAKTFREIDLDSDGKLDRQEFTYACGPQRMNLGLPPRDVDKLFNEFAQSGDTINSKQFLRTMASLDKPDLDLVSLLSEYKGKALSTLVDRLNEHDRLSSSAVDPRTEDRTEESSLSNDTLSAPSNLELRHEQTPRLKSVQSTPSLSSESHPTPNLTISKRSASSAILSHKSQISHGRARSMLSQFPPISPVHRVWSNKKKKIEISKVATDMSELQTNSIEAVTLRRAARDCYAGYFTGRRVRRTSPSQHQSMSILEHEQSPTCSRTCRSTSMSKLPKVSPVRQRSSMSTLQPPPSWHNDSERERQLHLERTEGSRRLSNVKIEGYRERNNILAADTRNKYWRTARSRILGKTQTRAKYMANVFAQQEAELELAGKTGAKAGTRCSFAMRTKIGNGGLW